MATVSDRAHRRRLVSALRKKGAARSARVIAALSEVPRSRFVPQGTSAADAYADHALVLTADSGGRPTSTISQPSMIALMLEQLEARPGHRVLEVGTASGYTAALLTGLVRPTGSVVTVELDTALSAAAAERLAEHWPEAIVRSGDGWCGAPDAAPFDRVHVTVGVDDLSPHWLDQLCEGGVLVAPVMLRPGVELSVAFERRGSELVSRSARPCGFVRLRGPHATASSDLPLDETRTLLTDPLDEATAHHLRTLLAGTPADAGALDAMPDGWAARLALEQPHALAVLTTDPVPELRPGLFDPQGGGLALVAQDRVLSYGDPGAAALLHAQVGAGPQLWPQALRVTARPAPAPAPAGRWTVHKPHFSYALDLG